MPGQGIGVSLPKKEAWDKVTGSAKYNDDFSANGILSARMIGSPHAHAKIKFIDTTEALKVKGVRAIITGDYCNVLCGNVLEDRPIIAKEKVRYYGEPVAVVVAVNEFEAEQAAAAIKVEYEPLPVINSVRQAFQEGAPLVHENLASYISVTSEMAPKPGTNISAHLKIRKGDMARGWAESDVMVESSFILPQSDHLATETRNARAEIKPDGRVIIYSSSQAPFTIRKLISKYFQIDEGKISVRVPLVGGAFGGKAAVQLEFIAYLASKAVGGRSVRIANTRGEDMVTSPVGQGLDATVKLGAAKDGKIKAAEFTYLVDGGAYTDIAPRIAKSMAVDCTGPYAIENVWCDSFCIYTNHPFVTSLRGFGHASCTFVMERAMDKLAYALGMDAVELRLQNAIKEGDTSPTQVRISSSNTGNFAKCTTQLKNLINWGEGNRIELANDKVKAKGVGCFWKTSDSPTNAVSAVVLTFNPNGSINLNCGAVEFGPGAKTAAAQILAEKLQMDVNQIHVVMEVNTEVNPEHWKTVASMSTFMVGSAVMRAADDIIRQLKSLAGVLLRCPPEDLEVAGGKVYMIADPSYFVAFPELVHGYTYPNGNSIEGQIIGRGSYIMKHLTHLDKDFGKGKTGPSWTVGAQAVEVEYNKRDHTYRILKAVTVLDAGKVVNPKGARSVVMGGMSMGLGIGSREYYSINQEGVVENTSLRTYKLLRFGEQPQYLVQFVETPQIDAPYGARGISEHGVIGMPAALANALSCAAQVELNRIPISPELIWRAKKEKNQ